MANGLDRVCWYGLLDVVLQVALAMLIRQRDTRICLLSIILDGSVVVPGVVTDSMEQCYRQETHCPGLQMAA
jgi:hypothetical protein